jgi:hypothetical protein
LLKKKEKKKEQQQKFDGKFSGENSRIVAEFRRAKFGKLWPGLGLPSLRLSSVGGRSGP